MCSIAVYLQRKHDLTWLGLSHETGARLCLLHTTPLTTEDVARPNEIAKTPTIGPEPTVFRPPDQTLYGRGHVVVFSNLVSFVEQRQVQNICRILKKFPNFAQHRYILEQW